MSEMSFWSGNDLIQNARRLRDESPAGAKPDINHAAWEASGNSCPTSSSKASFTVNMPMVFLFRSRTISSLESSFTTFSISSSWERLVSMKLDRTHQFSPLLFLMKQEVFCIKAADHLSVSGNYGIAGMLIFPHQIHDFKS